MEKVKLIEQGVLENMREPLKKLSSDIEEDLDVPKIKEIGENIEIMKDNINECKEVFQKKLSDSQVLMIYKIDEKIEIKKQINELNKLEFNLNIKNLKKDKISSEKFFLEINREKGDSEQIPIDLSDIKINISKEFEINVVKNSEKRKEHMKDIEKRQVKKIEPSFLQQVISSMVSNANDDDEEEEEEEEDDKKKNKDNNKDDKEENKEENKEEDKEGDKEEDKEDNKEENNDEVHKKQE